MTVGVLARLGVVALIGNAGGAAVVTGFALYLAPTVLSADEYGELQRRSVPALVVFTVSALVFGGGGCGGGRLPRSRDGSPKTVRRRNLNASASCDTRATGRSGHSPSGYSLLP